MPTDLYSTRQQLASQAGTQDVYQYDEIPGTLRVQIAQIAAEAIGGSATKRYAWLETGHAVVGGNPAWGFMRKTLCREYGRNTLANKRDAMDDVLAFLLEKASTAESLDTIELLCRTIDSECRTLHPIQVRQLGIIARPDDAIAEINHRLRRASIGYQYESGQLVRIDSQMIHSEVVVPALRLLSQPIFSGAQEEFLSAHRHYREGNHKDALVNASKSLESVLKTIFSHKGWKTEPNWNSKNLLDAAFTSELIPHGLVAHVKAIRATLEQGVPYMRNNMAGHGQGPTTKDVPDYIVAYALHITASAVQLLVEAAGMSDV